MMIPVDPNPDIMNPNNASEVLTSKWDHYRVDPQAMFKMKFPSGWDTQKARDALGLVLNFGRQFPGNASLALLRSTLDGTMELTYSIEVLESLLSFVIQELEDEDPEGEGDGFTERLTNAREFHSYIEDLNATLLHGDNRHPRQWVVRHWVTEPEQ